MNAPTANRGSGAALGFILGATLIVALGLVVKLTLIPAPVDAARADARYQALAEIRATEEKDLSQAGWIDQQRGIVRLPIDTALQIAAREWRNPDAARADLKAREAKATAELPKAPAQPNPFE
jgi:hypothetical protein